jgi:hypothetical protein
MPAIPAALLRADTFERQAEQRQQQLARLAGIDRAL